MQVFNSEGPWQKYRVTRRVFSEPIISKLHLLYQKNLAGHLKTPKVTRISAIYTNFSHSPAHSGPICFYRTKNLKLPSGTNKSKWNFHFHLYQPRINLKNCGDQKFFVKILCSKYYYSIHLKKSGIAYVLNSFELNSTQFAKDAHVWSCRFAEYVAKMTQIDEID